MKPTAKTPMPIRPSVQTTESLNQGLCFGAEKSKI